MILKLYNYGTLRCPSRAHIDDAGCDVYIPDNYDIILEPHSYTSIDLKFGIDIPKGYYGYLCGRSSGAMKGLIVHQAPIDTGYTGPIHCIIFNNSNETVILDCNKAVAQLVIQPVTYPILTEYYDEFITRKNNDWNGSTDKGEKIQ